MQANILIDAREFVPGHMTGIGRMLSGFIDALAKSPKVKSITIATHQEALPGHFNAHVPISLFTLPKSFFKAEWILSKLTNEGYVVYISPYPKLPTFGVHCLSVHTIHDVIDLRDPIYRKRLKAFLDKSRLRFALRRADMTWYDSNCSMKETESLVGFTGKSPRVRYLGIDQRFTNADRSEDSMVLEKYGLRKGYIIAVGNGLPHKNLGILLQIAERISRIPVFVGVPVKNMQYWKSMYRKQQAIWIEKVREEEMPSLLRQAFCLSQPSLAEGYGYPPLEAMACGTPAVVSNIPVLVETTGGSALVADPRDGTSWIEAYEQLENEKICQEQITKGLRWVAHLQGKRGWMQHVSDIEDLIESNFRITADSST